MKSGGSRTHFKSTWWGQRSSDPRRITLLLGLWSSIKHYRKKTGSVRRTCSNGWFLVLSRYNTSRKTVIGRRRGFNPVGPDKYVAISRKVVKTRIWKLKYYKYQISKQKLSPVSIPDIISTFSSPHLGKVVPLRKIQVNVTKIHQSI